MSLLKDYIEEAKAIDKARLKKAIVKELKKLPEYKKKTGSKGIEELSKKEIEKMIRTIAAEKLDNFLVEDMEDIIEEMKNKGW